MTAIITGFRTRSQLRMRAPLSISHNITPLKGGVAVHYGGPTPNPAPTNHAICEATWRSWQNYHMDSHGWVDIAYTAGYCNHGYVLAGRGYGIRTAANGTNDANQNFYAFVWVGGGDAKPNQIAYNALEWLIADARTHGDAGIKVKPHSYFFSTSCPGNAIRDYAKQFDGKSINATLKPVSGKYLTEDGKMDAGTTRVVQKFLTVPVITGVWDMTTTRRLQMWLKVPADGIIGPVTTKAAQRRFGVEQTGSWNLGGVGDPTTRGFERYLNAGIKAGTFTP